MTDLEIQKIEQENKLLKQENRALRSSLEAYKDFIKRSCKLVEKSSILHRNTIKNDMRKINNLMEINSSETSRSPAFIKYLISILSEETR